MENLDDDGTPKKKILILFVREFGALVRRHGSVMSLHLSEKEEIIQGAIHLTGHPQHVRFAVTDTLGGNVTLRFYKEELGTPACDAEEVKPINIYGLYSPEIAEKTAALTVDFLLNPK